MFAETLVMLAGNYAASSNLSEMPASIAIRMLHCM